MLVLFGNDKILCCLKWSTIIFEMTGHMKDWTRVMAVDMKYCDVECCDVDVCFAMKNWF